jgi:hypothetical protein
VPDFNPLEIVKRWFDEVASRYIFGNTLYLRIDMDGTTSIRDVQTPDDVVTSPFDWNRELVAENLIELACLLTKDLDD